MPVMEPDLDAGLLRRWAQGIDDGPFSSLCWGERIAFGNPEALTLLGALAAWTQRVPLITTVVVPQLHDPVLLAKSLATGDMLCDGRLTVGIGVGGRHEDYRAVGADPAAMLHRCKRPEGELDDPAARLARDLCDQPDTAGAVVARALVEHRAVVARGHVR